ncbi:hypothetical protein ACOBR2_06555 [Telmatobacter bradus]|uniref:hypothetical protein n=1 Tax=Telmatobacter bradus TaxID=474953 RepID=UPI003B434187
MPGLRQRKAVRGGALRGRGARGDEYGEIVFESDAGAVVTRTPEELGLARVVKDVPAPPELSNRMWFEGRRVNPMQAAGVTPDGQKARRGAVAVRAAEVGRKVKAVKKEDGGTCAAEGCGCMAYGGRKYCTKRHAYKNAPQDGVKVAANKGVEKSVVKKLVPKNGGPSVAAGMDHQKAPETLIECAAHPYELCEVCITVGFSPDQLDRAYMRMSHAQRVAWLSGGLKAALLA